MTTNLKCTVNTPLGSSDKILDTLYGGHCINNSVNSYLHFWWSTIRQVPILTTYVLSLLLRKLSFLEK